MKNEHHEKFTQGKLIEKIKGELQNSEDKYQKAEKLRTQQNNEISKLSYIIKEAYDEIEKLKKDY